MITKITCFDFDGTLIHTPTPELGRPEWEKATGQSWSGRGWWGNAESLNLKVFYPPVNQWVHNKYLKEISNDENYVFVATGRLSKLERHVQKILNLHDIDVDLFCNTGGETFKFKCYLFEKIIKDNPSAKEFHLYDDRHEHLELFKKWARFQKISVIITDVINKTTDTIN